MDGEKRTTIFLVGRVRRSSRTKATDEKRQIGRKGVGVEHVHIHEIGRIDQGVVVHVVAVGVDVRVRVREMQAGRETNGGQFVRMRRHRRQALIAGRFLQTHRFLDVVLEENGAFRFGQMRGVFEAVSTVMRDV